MTPPNPSYPEQIAALTETVARLTAERDRLSAAMLHSQITGARWIACSDYLPDCTHEDNVGLLSQSVLVCDENDLSSLSLGHMRDGGTWELDGGDTNFMPPKTITHWMPRPNPPGLQVQSQDPRNERRQLIEAGSLEAAVQVYRQALSEAVEQLARGTLDAPTCHRLMGRWQTALLQAVQPLARVPE